MDNDNNYDNFDCLTNTEFIYYYLGQKAEWPILGSVVSQKPLISIETNYHASGHFNRSDFISNVCIWFFHACILLCESTMYSGSHTELFVNQYYVAHKDYPSSESTKHDRTFRLTR